MASLDTSTTGDPQAIKRIIAEAMANPQKYKDGIELIDALKRANGFTKNVFEDRTGMYGSNFFLLRKGGLTWDYVDAIIKNNSLNLPETQGKIDPRVKQYFYEKCGYFERTPENIRSQVDKVFQKNRDQPDFYPNFAEFFKALIFANGMQAYGSSDLETPAYVDLCRRIQSVFPDRWEEGGLVALMYQIGHDEMQPTNDILNAIVRSNALHFRMNGSEVDTAQIDDFFTKAGRIQWRAETLRQRGREVMQAIRQGESRITGISKPVTIRKMGEAFELLMPHKSNGVIQQQMLAANPVLSPDRVPKLTATRITHLFRGHNPIHPEEFDALFTIACQENGLTEADREALIQLPSGHKAQANGFTSCMMDLGYACLPPRGDALSWTALERASRDKHGEPNIKVHTIEKLKSGINPPTIFETVRALTRAFEVSFAHHKGGNPAEIRSLLDKMLQFTPYRYEELFRTPEDVIKVYREKFFVADSSGHLKLKDDAQMMSGQLISDLRSALGIEKGLGSAASAAGISSAAWGRFENGVPPDPDKYKLMLAALGITESSHYDTYHQAMDIARICHAQWQASSHEDKVSLGRRTKNIFKQRNV